jgi:DNA sulfur modification protein DndB
MKVTFPAIKGSQSGLVFYTVMATYKDLGKSFIFDDSDLPIEMRQQRTLNEGRAAAFSNYIKDNPESYVTGAVVGTIDDRVKFIPLESPFVQDDSVGLLQFDSDTPICLVDGQHRQRGISIAVDENPTIEDEQLPIVLYTANSIERKQQIFADQNGHTVKPSSSLNITFDHRGELNKFVKELASEIPSIKSRIDYESSSVGSLSHKFWPLVSFRKFICNITGMNERTFEKEVSDKETSDKLKEIIKEVISGFDHLPMWGEAINGVVPVKEVRENYIVAHAVFLEALGVWAQRMMFHFDKHGAIDYSFMSVLSKVDTQKLSTNWNGRCVSHQGTMVKTSFGVNSTAAMLCKLTGLELPDDLQKVDDKVFTSEDAAKNAQ